MESSEGVSGSGHVLAGFLARVLYAFLVEVDLTGLDLPLDHPGLADRDESPVLPVELRDVAHVPLEVVQDLLPVVLHVDQRRPVQEEDGHLPVDDEVSVEVRVRFHLDILEDFVEGFQDPLRVGARPRVDLSHLVVSVPASLAFHPESLIKTLVDALVVRPFHLAVQSSHDVLEVGPLLWEIE